MAKAPMMQRLRSSRWDGEGDVTAPLNTLSVFYPTLYRICSKSRRASSIQVEVKSCHQRSPKKTSGAYSADITQSLQVSGMGSRLGYGCAACVHTWGISETVVLKMGESHFRDYCSMNVNVKSRSSRCGREPTEIYWPSRSFT